MPADVVEAIETGLTVADSGALTDAQAISSEDFESVYFVSAETDGPGLEGSGDVGSRHCRCFSGPVRATDWSIRKTVLP